ncbi:hypothetical protein ACFLY7_00280 [Patescibacteria group bacterium]
MEDLIKKCEACGGPVEEDKYCVHCLEENGNLKSYNEILNGGIEWAMSEEGEKIIGKKYENEEEVKKMIEENMAKLPAWKK